LLLLDRDAGNTDLPRPHAASLETTEIDLRARRGTIFAKFLARRFWI
jgi:hypothetical protein